MNNKTDQDIGCFYSTNAHEILDEILQEFMKLFNKRPENIIEPCCGNWDLINELINENIDHKYIKAYDIKAVHEATIEQDTIITKPDYHNAYVVANPPYLAKNKLSPDLKVKYLPYLKTFKDLYHIYIDDIITSKCLGGLLILPLNFILSDDNSLRKQFITSYQIINMKIYEKQIFEATTSAVCAFAFKQRLRNNKTFDIPVHLYKKTEDERFIITLNNKNDYIFGSECIIQKYSQIPLSLSRFTDSIQHATNILITTLDPKMGATYDKNPQVNKLSDRSLLNIVSSITLTKKEQLFVINEFNRRLLKYREKYHSFFLPSFREFSRRRITFQITYAILGNIIRKLQYFKNSLVINNKLIKN